MDFNKIIARVKAILISPNSEWPVIAGEEAHTGGIYTGYVVPLAALNAVATFIKASVLGMGVLFLGTYRASVASGLTTALITFGTVILAVFILALIINALAGTFGGTKDSLQALKTSAYAYTGAIAGGILSLVPGIGLLLAFAGGVYSIYLLYLALPHTMKAPKEKTVGYTVVVVLAAIVLSIVTSSIIGRSMMRSGVGGGLLGSIAADSGGSFEGNSVGGALQGLAKTAEEAGKKMEAAQKSGDAEAQLAAAGDMLKSLGSGGAAAVEALPTDRIKSFLPATLGGLKQIDSEASRSGAFGMQVAEAKANYGDGGDRQVHLEITDMGSAKGLMGLASWVNVEEDKQTSTGYEKTYKQGENMVHEEWDSQSQHGEFSVVLAQRFIVKVDGRAASVDQLKAYIGGIDLAGLAALKNEGVKASN